MSRRSIFADMSESGDQGYFADGISEELLNMLAQVPRLHVAGRTSSFSFKGKPTDIKEVGQALNVATVLEGGVRKSGDRLRVTAQLVNVRSDGRPRTFLAARTLGLALGIAA